MDQTFWLWILGGAFTVLGAMLAIVWSLLRAEQKAQDDAIAKKADQERVDDNERRWEKELDRMRFEHDKVIDRVEGRFEKELENVESRLCTKMETMEATIIRQIELVMEILKSNGKQS